MSPTAVPVLTLCSLDPVLRGSGAAALLCDLPGALVVQHDLGPAARDGSSRLRRTVFGAGGVDETFDVELGHGCLSCAVREDILATLRRLIARRPPAVILALPVAAEPLPFVRAVQHLDPDGGSRPCAVVTVAEAGALEEDLLGDATLRERGIALFDDDDRAVGEALAHQLEYCDAVLTGQPLAARAARLLAHLGTPPWSVEPRLLHDADVGPLIAIGRPVDDPRGDPRRAVPAGVGDGDGVWTLDLVSDRPLHPDRLLDRIEDLGLGRLRARGHFWVPTRPMTVCAWDGAGGRLSVGSLGPWPTPRRATRIVVTGSDADGGPRTARRVRNAFADVCLTDAEHARGPAWWSGRTDRLDPWLGDLDACA